MKSVPLHDDSLSGHDAPVRASNKDIPSGLCQFEADISEQLDALYPDAPSEDCARDMVASGSAWRDIPPQLRSDVGQLLHEVLTVPVRYLIEAGGQRWRCGLMLQAVEALGGDSRRFAALAASAELMHTGSLMIDDIEDGARLRRGRQPAHRVFGVPVSLNAATVAYFTFDRVIRRIAVDDPVLRLGLYETHLEVMRAAHAGQALDIEGHHEPMRQALSRGSTEALLRRVRLTHRLKSGAVVGAGLDMAAQLMAVSPQTRSALAAFGEAVGTAYQITDDVADLSGACRAGRMTKQVGEDLRNGKVTMPIAHAAALLPAKIMAPLWQRIRGESLDEQAVREITAVLDECGALTACVREAESLVDQAWLRLEPLLPLSEQTALLYAMARRVVGNRRVA